MKRKGHTPEQFILGLAARIRLLGQHVTLTCRLFSATRATTEMLQLF